MQLNATQQDVSNQTKNTHNSKLYITSSRVVALFRWQENTATATAMSKDDWQRFPQRRWGGVTDPDHRVMLLIYCQSDPHREPVCC